MDEPEQPPAYPRRGILKAGLLIGGIAGFAMKAGAEGPLSALDERQAETGQDGDRRSTMPLARIDLSKDAPPERVRIVSEAIYQAMVEIANVPLHDKFQVITRHAFDEITSSSYKSLGSAGDRST
jgi:hypothetical protein